MGIFGELEMKKYRIVESCGRFYQQKRKWFIWNYFNSWVKYKSRNEPIFLYFFTLKEAQHYINTKKVEDAANKLLGKKIHYVD